MVRRNSRSRIMIAEEAGTGAANTEDADADADCQRHLASCHLTHWPPANEGPPKATEKGLLIGVLLGVAYFMHYFWKTPVFILPLDILGRHVVTVFSTDLDLQACFSMAYTFGCVAGKFIGVWIITSRFFFRHRLALLSTVLCASMLCESLGMLVFSSTPPLQVLCVGVSAALTSWLWPGFLTYIEGRQNTELLFAVLSASYVSAGNASRGTANWVLAWGVPPLWMPLVVGACALPVALVCLLLAHRCPTPSAEDVAVRTRRKGMSRRDKAAFVWEWLGGIVLLLVPYVTLSAVRNFRDFYSHQVFAAAMNVEQVPSSVYFLVDLPGAVLSAVAVALFNRVADHRRCVFYFLFTWLATVALALAATALLRAGALGGVAFHVALGLAFYVAFGVVAGPLHERWLAASRTEGTCAFLAFLVDSAGYAGTLVLLLYATFGSLRGSASTEVLDLFLTIEWSAMIVIGVFALCLVAYFMRRLPLSSYPAPVSGTPSAGDSGGSGFNGICNRQ